MTDSSFRQLCRLYGADAVWTEMICARAMRYTNPKLKKWFEQDPRIFADLPFEDMVPIVGSDIPGNLNVLRTAPEESPAILQLFGKDPEDFESAAAFAVELGFAGIDLNMGCPAKHVVGAFHGCSLMKDIPLAQEIVRSARRGIGSSEVSLSVKFRSGWDSVIAPEFARAMEEAGADLLTIHGRTKNQGFSGMSDRKVIQSVVQAVRIPVIGNGDIVDGASAAAMVSETWCAGVMVGRAMKGAPWIFSDIQKVNKRTLRTISFGHFPDRAIDTAYEHCVRLEKMKGEGRGLLESRKHLVAYIRGFAGASTWRARIVQVSTLEQVHEALSEISVEMANDTRRQPSSGATVATTSLTKRSLACEGG